MRHNQSLHDGVMFSFDQCDYKATLKGSLAKHLKSIHKGLKFSCDQCDYKASVNNSST